MSWLGLVWDLGTPDVRATTWHRRMRVRVGPRTAEVSGVTEKGAFLELGLHGAAFRVGTTITLRDFELLGSGHPIEVADTEAVVERVNWHGIAVTFSAPAPALAEWLRT
jgi:hypothetical protein